MKTILPMETIVVIILIVKIKHLNIHLNEPCFFKQYSTNKRLIVQKACSRLIKAKDKQQD